MKIQITLEGPRDDIEDLRDAAQSCETADELGRVLINETGASVEIISSRF